MRFLGVNAAGLRSKLLSFNKVLTELKPSVFFVEETKVKYEGRLRLENYIVFEKIRQDRNGGGLAIGCIKDLNPIWVREGEGDIEALSVEISVKNLKIRCCVAYGFQENENIEKKNNFWKYLDEEALIAKNAGSGLIIQMDGNLWAGRQIIPNDPRQQNRNGKLFEEFLFRNSHLSVVNALDICEGVITRTRKSEESILDFFVVCNLVLPHVTKMVIDEENKYVLTNFKGKKAKNSDHATEYMDVNLNILSEKPKRKVMWNFKNKSAQEKFKKLTSETNDFSHCFDNDLSVIDQIDKWRTIFNLNVQKAFRRIRITKRNRTKTISPVLSSLINERNKVFKKGENECKLEGLDEKISNFEARINFEEIKNNFKNLSQDPENVNIQEIWKKMNKLWPKFTPTLPAGKKNHFGKVISDPKELKKLLAKEYKERLRTRPTRPDLNELEKRKNNIFKLKLAITESNKSKKWTMSDLDDALGDLKNNKSRDDEGLINEIFKLNVIGEDLKKSILLMFNRLKEENIIPIFMNYANITTVPKKGSKLLLENERGIFRVSVLRSILMRIIYNEKYEQIDRKMSDCQMGARKNKGCRNNLFIINGIIHDVMSSNKKTPVLLQIYDYKQMFDAINLQQALSDIYDVGVDDDNLSLLYQANNNVKMAVNTPDGLTERQTLENVVLQGDTWGSILASVQVDSIGKEVSRSEFGYKYKDKLVVTLLGLVDDMIGVSEVGYKAQQLNAIINVKTAEKRLQFGVSKCKSMIVGKNLSNIINTKLSIDQWNIKHVENGQSGDSILTETYQGRVDMEQTDQTKYLGLILSNRGSNMPHIREIKKKSIWITRKIFAKLESLNLGKYYFQSAIIFLNLLLRSSILYACETLYNLKETEIRQLERIEEGYLRMMFKTSKGCPIAQLYLETGHFPARFAIMKSRLMFLKSILDENPSSQIRKFLELQLENPTRGDWASSCQSNLRDLQINQSFEEIKQSTKKQFNIILKESILEKAFEYLMAKRGSKGKEIHYSKLKMSEYLQPGYENISRNEQLSIFSIRNRMIEIPANFPLRNIKEICQCGNEETMKHLYICEYLNNDYENEKPIFEKIFEENIIEQKKVNKLFIQRLKRRLERKQTIEISSSDPLYNYNFCTVMDD